MPANSNLTRRALLALALGAAHGAAQAQLPAGATIRWVVGSGPGGALDTLSRLLATEAAKLLGAPIVIENKPGNSGIASAAEVARASDGRTYLFTTVGPLVNNVAVFSKLPYDPAKDFSAVIALGRFPLALYVPANSPYKTVAALIDGAKARPRALNFGTLGPANLSNLAAERLGEMQGFQFTPVPYNGEPAMMVALASGQVDAVITTLGGGMALIQGGRIRALGLLDSARFSLLPEVATLAEQGITNAEAAGVPCIVAPSRTPKDEIERMNAAVNQVLRRPEISKRMLDLLMVPEGGAPEVLSRIIQAEGERWIPIIKRLGIKEN